METKSIILIRTHISRMIKYACEVLMAAIVIIVFLQVLFRYVFSMPFSWAEELAKFCFAWVAVLGSVLGIENEGHFRMDMLVEKLDPKIRRWVYLVVKSIMFVFLITLTFYSSKLTVVVDSQTSPSMRLPLSYIVIMLPVGFLLMCFFLILTGVSAKSKLNE